MTRRNRASSSSLFLMELIVAIFFFSAASAVCIQFFVKSHLLSNDSSILNHAVNECTSTAELIDSSEGIEDSMNLLIRLYPNGNYPDIRRPSSDVQNADIQIYYNDSFEECLPEEAAYILTLQLKQEDGLLHSDMQVTSAEETKASEVIYELNTKHHIARRTDYEEK